jgi:F-type H+-transporting ATPase subunit delta
VAAVSIRYARAFAEAVFAHKLDGERSLRELGDAVQLAQANLNLRRVWENPSIPAAQKTALLDAIVARTGYLPEVRSFLAVIIEHRRINILPQIVRQLQLEMDRRMGVTEAEVTVAHELTADVQRDLEQRIAQATGGRSLRANYRVDRGILGGAVVRIGSTVYDGSVKGKLERLREILANA